MSRSNWAMNGASSVGMRRAYRIALRIAMRCAMRGNRKRSGHSSIRIMAQSYQRMSDFARCVHGFRSFCFSSLYPAIGSA